MELCPQGKQIALRCRNIMLEKNGKPTSLYWHLLECSKCEELQEITEGEE